MKIVIALILSLTFMLALIGCNNKEVVWNGEVECIGDLTMVFDFTNLYEYVGMVDYVFVGTVEEAEVVIPEKRAEYEQSFSKY